MLQSQLVVKNAIFYCMKRTLLLLGKMPYAQACATNRIQTAERCPKLGTNGTAPLMQHYAALLVLSSFAQIQLPRFKDHERQPSSGAVRRNVAHADDILTASTQQAVRVVGGRLWRNISSVSSSE